MKKLIQHFAFIAVLTTTMTTLNSCSKTPKSSTPSPTPSSDTLSQTKQCYNGTGTFKFSSSSSNTSVNVDMACGSYIYNESIAGNYCAQLTVTNSTTFGTILIFYFGGKTYPTTGTYKVVTMAGYNGVMEYPKAGEIAVSWNGVASTRTIANNTVDLVNDNGKITLTSSQIKLYDIANNESGKITELNATKTTTKR